MIARFQRFSISSSSVSIVASALLLSGVTIALHQMRAKRSRRRPSIKSKVGTHATDGLTWRLAARSDQRYAGAAPGSALDLQLTFEAGHAFTNVEKAKPSGSNLL